MLVVNTVCPAVAVNAWRLKRFGSNASDVESDSIHISPTAGEEGASA